MAQSLSVNGVPYVSATQAGKQFGYTKDYMLMLARDGKIDGRKIGHRWYINTASVQRFFEGARAVREVRHAEISKQRKQELRVHELSRKKPHHRAALIETLVILVLGLSLGVTGYLGTANTYTAQTNTAGASFFERIAVALYALISPEDTVVTTMVDTTAYSKEFIPVDAGSARGTVASHGTTTRTSFVVAPDTMFTATTIESVTEAFSDDVSVSVDPKNPNTGIIIPHFNKKDGEAYRFLLVPVNPPGG